MNNKKSSHGEILKELVKRHRYTDEMFASLINRSKQGLRHMYTRGVLDKLLIEKACEVLNEPIEQFFDGEKSAETTTGILNDAKARYNKSAPVDDCTGKLVHAYEKIIELQEENIRLKGMIEQYIDKGKGV